MKLSLLRTILRDLLRRPLHSALMVLGIALGVSVVVAIDSANLSATRSFDRSSEAIVGQATHQVRGGPSGLQEEIYRQVRQHVGPGAAAPIVEGLAVAPDLGGRTVRLLGVDPLAEAPFRDLLPEPGGWRSGMADLISRPGTALLSQDLAADLSRSSLRLLLGDRMGELTVIGILQDPQPGSRGRLRDAVLMDLSTAQELLGAEGRLSRIDLILDEAEAAALSDRLPAGVSLGPASKQRRVAEELTAAFRLNLTALSLLALIVGIFLVYNTVAFSVLQRRGTHATLRALGVTRGQILSMVLLEVGLVSAAGSALGLGLGWVLAQGAIGMVSRTIHDLYLPISVTRVEVLPEVLVKGILMGFGAGQLAAALPALEAAQVETAAALRRSSLERRVRRWLPGVTLAGLLSILVGGAMLLITRQLLAASLGGIFGILIGLAMLAPQCTMAMMGATSRLLPGLLGPFGRMAPRSVRGAISRTGVAVAALMVSLSVAIGVGLMIGSFRSTVQNWLALTLRADLYVAVPDGGGSWSVGALSPQAQRAVEALEGVERVETFRSTTIDSEVGELQLLVVDAQREREAGLYRFARGNPQSAWQAVREGAALVSEPFAYRYRSLVESGSIALRTERGLQRYELAGVYYDYASEHGAVMLARETYLRDWGDPTLTSLGVFLQDGQAAEPMADRIRTALAGTGVLVQLNQELRQQALRVFDSTFAITSALRVLAVITALAGVFSALLALQLERSRELATLRALGLTRAGLQQLAMLETGLVGASASLLALPTGLVLALLLIYVINLRAFGWTIQLQLEIQPFLQALLVGIGSALAAAIYPVLRLGRRPVAAGLWQE